MKKTTLLVAVILAAIFATAQVPSKFGMNYNATNFNYGFNGIPSLQVLSASGTSGSYTVTLAYGMTHTVDGISFAPLSTTAAVTIGAGAAQETVTPSAVSCSTPSQYGTCTFTATFTYAHGNGDSVRSGTTGLQEAINYAAANGGGKVFFLNNVTLLAPTSGTTRDSTANLLPASSIIQYVGGVVTTAISGGTCASWAVGDGTTGARFVAADTTLTKGETQANTGTAWTTGIASATTGTYQASAAKVRLTCGTGAATAGAVHIWIGGYVSAAPTI